MAFARRAAALSTASPAPLSAMPLGSWVPIQQGASHFELALETDFQPSEETLRTNAEWAEPSLGAVMDACVPKMLLPKAGYMPNKASLECNDGSLSLGKVIEPALLC